MLLIRKVGHYAAKHCYVLSKLDDGYTCNYVTMTSIDPSQTSSEAAAVNLRNLSTWDETQNKSESDVLLIKSVTPLFGARNL